MSRFYHKNEGLFSAFFYMSSGSRSRCRLSM